MPMKRKWVGTFVAAALLMSVIPTAAPAETGRTLGDYRFVPVQGTDAPFITTHFRNYTGLAWASNLELPLLIIDTEPPDTLISLSGNFVFVVAQFEFQKAVHPRVAIKLAGGGLARVGTSASALLSQGVTTLIDARLGGLFELWRNDTVLLSAFADVGYVDGLAIDFVQFTEDVIDGNYENASLVVTGAGGVVIGGLRTAWALNSWSGIIAYGQAGYYNVEGFAVEDASWRLGGAASVDFGQRGNAPVGLSFNVDADKLTPQAFEGETAVAIGAGVHYTGREDLNLGIEMHVNRLPLAEWDEIAYPVSVGLAFNYFF
jgi:hypothetical protein